MSISKSTLRSILFILIGLTALSYYHRNPTGDDAWFAEQSYWFQKEGIIRSEFFSGILGWENQLLVSHKLFLIFGAGLISLFGHELPVVQFVGLFFFCLLIGELIYYVYKQEKSLHSGYLIAVLILVFSNRLLIKMSFENRPELMLAALGFGSFLCIQAKNHKKIYAALAGILAGAAMLCHLNGIIYLLAGFATYIYCRHYRQGLVFALAGGFTALAYFVDIAQATDGFAVWYYQFRHDPATQSAFGLYSKLLVMLTYPTLFFESPEQAALSLLLVYLLWHQRKFLQSVPVVLKVYSLCMFIAFWLITKKNTGTYMPLFMPFMLVLIYELYRLRPFKHWGLTLTLAIYFVIGLYGTIEIIYKNLTMEYLPVSYQKLRPHIHPQERGLVPLTFFFNEYEQYAHLLSHENYGFHATSTDNPADQMANWARQNDVDFILMDYQYRPASFYPKPGTSVLPHYKLNYFDGRFAVYITRK